MKIQPEMEKRLEPFLNSIKPIEMMREIHKQPDRGAAIVAFAYLDEMLEQAVCCCLRDHKKTAKELFKNGPISTFDARRKLGYLLGLYGPKSLRDLGTLSQIRNRFAHRHRKVTFATTEIEDLCRNLHITKWLSMFGDHEPNPTNREIYLRTISMIAGFLRTEIITNSPPLREPRVLKF